MNKITSRDLLNPSKRADHPLELVKRGIFMFAITFSSIQLLVMFPVCTYLTDCRRTQYLVHKPTSVGSVPPSCPRPRSSPHRPPSSCLPHTPTGTAPPGCVRGSRHCAGLCVDRG